MKMQQRELTSRELMDIARHAATNWEFSCDWNRARESAYDYAADMYCAILTRNQSARVMQFAWAIVDEWRQDAKKASSENFGGAK